MPGADNYRPSLFLADGLALTALTTGMLAPDERRSAGSLLGLTGTALFFGGAPFVHGMEGFGQRAFKSAALRVGAVSAGFFLGLNVARLFSQSVPVEGRALAFGGLGLVTGAVTALALEHVLISSVRNSEVGSKRIGFTVAF